MQVNRPNHKLKRGPCSIKIACNLEKKFEKTGCTCDRPRSGLSRVPVEVVAEVHNTMTTGPLYPARNVSRNLHVLKATVLQIMHSVLRMFRFRFMRIQALEPEDNQQRGNFVNFFLIRYDEDKRWPQRILWTDEAHFTFAGNVNSKNCVYWAEKIFRVWHQCLHMREM